MAHWTWRDTLLMIGLVSLPLYLFPHLAFLQHANEMPRMFATEAMARGHLYIDDGISTYRYRKRMDISQSFCLSGQVARALRASGAGPIRSSSCRPHFYSNKAPGPSAFAVPFYRLALLQSRITGKRATYAQKLWWSRLGVSVLSFVLLLLGLSSVMERLDIDPHPRRATMVAYGTGSLALVYAVQFMSHELAAAGALVSFALLLRKRLSPAVLFGAGLTAGIAVAADYQSALVVAVVFVFGLFRLRHWYDAVIGIAGAALPLGLLAWYHAACFGWPLWTGYEFLVDRSDQALHGTAPLGIVGPQLHALIASLFSARDGLFFLSPWFIATLPGLAILLGGAEHQYEPHDHEAPSPDRSLGRRLATRFSLADVWALLGIAIVSWAVVALLTHTTANRGVLAPSAGLWSISGIILVLTGRMRFRRPETKLTIGSVMVALGITTPILERLLPQGWWQVFAWTTLGLWPAMVVRIRPNRYLTTAGIALAVFDLLYGLAAGQAGSIHGHGFLLAGWLAAGILALTLWATGSDGPPRRPRDAPSTKSLQFSVGLVILVILTLSLWFLSSVRFWHGGWQVGPRYLAVALPFAALGAAPALLWAWRHRWAWAIVSGLIVVSMVVYVFSAATFPHYPKSFKNPLFDLVFYLFDRGYVATNLGQWFHLTGASSLIPYLVLSALLAWFVAAGRLGFRSATDRGGRRLVIGVLGICLALFVLAGYRRLPHTNFERCCSWITRMWDRERHAASRKQSPTDRLRRSMRPRRPGPDRLVKQDMPHILLLPLLDANSSLESNRNYGMIDGLEEDTTGAVAL